MKRFGNPLLSFAAPMLVLLALLGVIHREGRDRVQSLPAVIVGSGLIVAGAIRRSKRRKMLLIEIKKSKNLEKL